MAKIFSVSKDLCSAEIRTQCIWLRYANVTSSDCAVSVDGFGRRLEETAPKLNATVQLTVPVLVRNNRNGLRDGSGLIQIKRTE